jgi:hypothetical protein
MSKSKCGGTHPTVSILSIDAWGNQEDGFEWNNWRKVGDAPIKICDQTDEEILQYMCDEGFITQTVGGRVDDDQYNKVICDDATGEPLFAIAYGEAV